jgi:hypothetical protein
VLVRVPFVGVTLVHGYLRIRLGGRSLSLQNSKLKLLVLHLLVQLLELLTSKLSSLKIAFGSGAFQPFSLDLASSAGLSDCGLLVLWEVLPLVVSVPAVLPLVRTCDAQG